MNIILIWTGLDVLLFYLCTFICLVSEQSYGCHYVTNRPVIVVLLLLHAHVYVQSLTSVMGVNMSSICLFLLYCLLFHVHLYVWSLNRAMSATISPIGQFWLYTRYYLLFLLSWMCHTNFIVILLG